MFSISQEALKPAGWALPAPPFSSLPFLPVYMPRAHRRPCPVHASPTAFPLPRLVRTGTQCPSVCKGVAAPAADLVGSEWR